MNASTTERSGPALEGTREPLLCDRVSRTVRRYLSDLDNTECQEGLYDMVLAEVERPLLQEVMNWHGGNQSRAAETLGINRATLRKKLLSHGLI